MARKTTLLTLFVVMSAFSVGAQEVPRWNLNVGGGVGFPVANTSNFANAGGNFVVGAGPNLGPLLGVDGEFMWQDLPVKQSVITQLNVPNASARQYSLTGNLIFRIPMHSRLGAYVIGGGGWYRRTGETTAPALIPGTVCPPFWNWWGACINGLWPTNFVLSSKTWDAFGGNIGGGVTFRLGDGDTHFYAEVRYHHAPHDPIATDVLPLTFGFRW